MTVQDVFVIMSQPVLTRVRSVATDNGWEYHNRARDRFEKDGYEIYFQGDDGFEVTIRDPESMERRAVYEHRGQDVHSPFYIACLQYIVENVEQFVSECDD
jgi:hypothetical protein